MVSLSNELCVKYSAFSLCYNTNTFVFLPQNWKRQEGVNDFDWWATLPSQSIKISTYRCAPIPVKHSSNNKNKTNKTKKIYIFFQNVLRLQLET